VGGCDIICELAESGELKAMIQAAARDAGAAEAEA
jgi:monothiol glutaredoxin